MRRISIIVIIIVLGLIVAARLFFVAAETYKSESNIDISKAPSLVECANPVVLTIDKDDITRINDRAVEENNIESVLLKVAATTSDACISIHISGLASTGKLIKINSIADKIGLRSQLVIIPD